MGRPRKDIDIEALRREYTAGKRTNVELAALFNDSISPQRIGQLAKEHGWDQDLTAAVRTATRAAVIRKTAQQGANSRRRVAASIAAEAISHVQGAVDKERGYRPEKVQALVEQMIAASEAEEVNTNAQAVMDAAEANAGVILKHQRIADDLLALAVRLRQELLAVTVAPVELAELLAQVAAAGDDGAKIAAKLQGLLSMGSRIASLDKLAAAAVKIVTLERQAHSLDDDKPVEDNSYEAALRRLSEGAPS